MAEHDIEREAIECLFRLGGGELEDEPWGIYAYWYEGSPEYAASEEQEGYVYRTVIAHCLFSEPQPPEDGWERVAMYQAGEADCWRDGAGTDAEIPSPDCPLCEGDGIVYLGEGWAEVVFRAPEDDDEDDPEPVKDQAIRVLESSESGDEIIKGLRDLGFERSFRPIDVFDKVWEHPALKDQDTSGGRILNAKFCTLYEWSEYGELAFVIGRIGNTLTLIREGAS